MEYIKKVLENGTEVYLINSDSCATTYVEMDFYSRMNKAEARKCLVNKILMEGSKKYPSKREISIDCDREYCTIGSHSYTMGDIHSNSFYIDTLTKESLTRRQDVFEKSLEMLYEVAVNPLIEKGGFKQEYFQRSKEDLLVELKRLELNKDAVSYRHFIETFIGDSPFAYPKYGTVEEVEKLSNDGVFTQYCFMRSKFPRKFFVSTHLDADYVLRRIEDYFGRMPCCDDSFRISGLPKKEGKVRRLEETSNFEQCIVYVGFPYAPKKEVDAFSVLDAYIGGYSGGRLFTEIRTKRDMAYGAYSYFDRDTGIIYGKSGVDIKNKDRTIDIMLKEIAAAASGKITKKGFKEAKRYLLNSYKLNLHVKSRRLGAIECAVLRGEEESLKYYEKRFEGVNYEDVIKAALLIDTSSPIVYCLLQGEKK